MSEQMREFLRQYILGVLEDGEYGGDWLHEMAVAGASEFVLVLVRFIGYMLAILGGF